MSDETKRNPSTEPVEPLVRFDFGPETLGDEEPDFKAMAEAFHEFAAKAMAARAKKDAANEDAAPK
jgi:hypothetical protein